ncbi:unnamed protein product [Trypanosoma congolense IL3000]|uniref:Uncharacterized protein n=1 Tax=Trypanosoma congolense (strain IL3000) TaxID=1068625 RepID=F9W7G5_TRYCI|nr:conserved hypothetical protein [Trypanosoma congolense IL3000]CCD13131.1 unnamed protein product [Trypanosoma congolense IL3000]
MNCFICSKGDDARMAFGDPKRSRDVHDSRMERFNVEIRKNSALRNRALVSASLVGLSCAAGAIGALLGSGRTRYKGMWLDQCLGPIVIAHAISGGAAIAYTVCRSLAFERNVYNVELDRELWEIENHIVGEIQEMVAIYRAQGLSEDEAYSITRTFAKHPQVFANLMMVEELGYSRLEPPAWREAIVDAAIPAGVGYTAGWVLPLLPLITTGLGSARSEVLSVCTLAAGTVVVSVGQSEVFFGGYTSLRKTFESIAWNLAAVSAISGLMYVLSRR